MATLAGFMLIESPMKIIRDAGIEIAVFTPEDIHEPHQTDAT